MIKEFQGKYSFLSNFTDAHLLWKGILFRSSEYAYQCAKVGDWERQPQLLIERADDILFILTAPTPGQVKRRGNRIFCRTDWYSIRIDVMGEIVEAKFRQNPDLAQKLLDTDDQYLQEGNHWGDNFWGVCDDGYGRMVGDNYLGRILMDVRDKLRKERGR